MCRVISNIRRILLAIGAVLLACTAKHAPCPPEVTTEHAAAMDGGDPSVMVDGGPSAECVALCGVYVLGCSTSHPCGWRSGDCVTCTYANRCELLTEGP